MSVDINKDIIDFKALGQVISSRKKAFIILQVVVLALCGLYILIVPKEYSAHTEIAPEISNDETNMIENLLDMSAEMQAVRKNVDAVYPLMYPDVIKSDDFVAGLFDVKISTSDGKKNLTYYQYLKDHSSVAPWQQAGRWVKSLFASAPADAPAKPGNSGTVNQFTPEQERIATTIKNNIFCLLDRKMGILNLVVTDHDPLVATIIADSITQHLHDFVIAYRTSKARIDYDFCQKILKDAQADVEKAERDYVAFAGSNIGAGNVQTQTRKENLENALNHKRTILQACQTQVLAAQARVQETTPVFTVIKRPLVPHEPSAPKPIYIIIYALIIANILMLAFIFRKRLLKAID